MTSQFDDLTKGIAQATAHLEAQAKTFNPEIRLQELTVGITPYVEQTLQTAENLSSTLLQTDADDKQTLWDKYTAAASSRNIKTPAFTVVDFQGLSIEGNQPFSKLIMVRPGQLDMHISEHDPEPSHFALVNPGSMPTEEKQQMLKEIHSQNTTQIGGPTELPPGIMELRDLLTLNSDNKPIWVRIDDEDKYIFLSPTMENTLTSRIIERAKPMLEKEEPMSIVIPEVKKNMELDDRMSAGVVASNIKESFVQWTLVNSIPVEPSKVSDYPARADLKNSQ